MFHHQQTQRTQLSQIPPSHPLNQRKRNLKHLSNHPHQSQKRKSLKHQLDHHHQAVNPKKTLPLLQMFPKIQLFHLQKRKNHLSQKKKTLFHLLLMIFYHHQKIQPHQHQKNQHQHLLLHQNLKHTNHIYLNHQQQSIYL